MSEFVRVSAHRRESHSSPLLVGLYAWLAAAFTGAILLDVVYFRLLEGVLTAAAAADVFATVSDALLPAGFLLLVAALGALALSWSAPLVRNLLLASLIALSGELILPLLFARSVAALERLYFGPLLRLTPAVAASLLALVALYQSSRQRRPRQGLGS